MSKQTYHYYVSRNRQEKWNITYYRDSLNNVLGSIKPNRFATYDSNVLSILYRINHKMLHASYSVDTNDIRQWNEMNKEIQDSFLKEVNDIDTELKELQTKFKNMLFFWMQSFDIFLTTMKIDTYLDKLGEKYYTTFIVEILEKWFPDEIPSNVKMLIKEIKGV